MVLLAGSPPIERTATISLPGWPAGAPPLRLVLVSDLHTAWPGDTPARLAATMDSIEAQHPDVLVIAGDILSNGSLAYGYSFVDSLAPVARVHPRLGCFAVPGNHDYPYIDRLDAALAGVGCRLLDNRAARAGPLALFGVSDSIFGRPDVSGALSDALRLGGVPVLITHNPTPMYWLWRIAPLPGMAPLALAGHTHCGQVALPVVGILWAEDRGRTYECGLVRAPKHGHSSVTGAGLGTSNLPIRLDVPPDYWMLTLKGA